MIEPLANGVASRSATASDLQPVFCSPLDRLRDALAKMRPKVAPRDLPSLVHAARVRIKRARALLRLLQPYLDTEIFHERDSTLRAAADSLAGTRDRDVIRGELERAAGKLAGADRVASLAWIGRVLPRTGNRNGVDSKQAVRKAERAAAAVVGNLFVTAAPSNLISFCQPGVEKAFRKARKAMKRAKESDRAEDFHAWRKWTKRLFLQIELLERAGVAVNGRTLKRLDALQDKLGKHHDLALASAFIRNHTTPDQAPFCELYREIEEERRELERKVLKRGKKVFSPGARNWCAGTFQVSRSVFER